MQANYVASRLDWKLKYRPLQKIVTKGNKPRENVLSCRMYKVV